MNIIKLHKSITLNVFAILGLIRATNINSISILFSQYSKIYFLCLLIGLAIEWIFNIFGNKTAFNFSFPTKIPKYIYFTIFYYGIIEILLPYTYILLIIFILACIPIKFLRKSIITNIFAFIGLFLLILIFIPFYCSGIDYGGSGDFIIFIFVPISIIFTIAFILLSLFEFILTNKLFKSENYGKFLERIPVWIHLPYIYILDY